MVESLFRYLEAEWKVIGQAPFTFLVALAIVGAIIWIVANGAAKLQLANLRSALELSDRQIADYKDKLAGASPEQAASRMAALEARIAMLEPRTLSPAQVLAFRAAVESKSLGIAVNRDFDSSNVDSLYRQVLAIFQQTGWAVQDGVVFGDGKGPPCGLRLISRKGTSVDALAAIRSGLQAANIAYVEEADQNPSNVSVPQLLFSSPFEPVR